MTEPHAYTRQEAADFLRVSTKTISRMIAAGTIDSARIGGRLFIPITEVHRLLEPGATTSTRRRAAS